MKRSCATADPKEKRSEESGDGEKGENEEEREKRSYRYLWVVRKKEREISGGEKLSLKRESEGRDLILIFWVHYSWATG